ncbi:hypothetical protein [Enterococcus phage vB_Efs8_KEN04]
MSLTSPEAGWSIPKGWAYHSPAPMLRGSLLQ